MEGDTAEAGHSNDYNNTGNAFDTEKGQIADLGTEKGNMGDMESEKQLSHHWTSGGSEGDDEEETDSDKSGKRCSGGCCLQFVRTNLLLILLIIGLLLGIGVGAAVRQANLSDREKIYFRFPGDLLMRMLKAMIIPLIVSSLISGLAGMDAASSSKMGLRALVYYLSTTFIAVVIGIIMVTTIQPGNRGREVPDIVGDADPGNVADSFLDLIRNMFPENLVESCFRQTKTYQVEVITKVNHTNESGFWEYEVSEYMPDTRMEFGMNVLGLVVFSVAFGIIISRMREDGVPLKNFFTSLAEASLHLVTVIIWYSPIGVFFLVASEVVNMDNPVEELQSLALYMVTVIAGLLVHSIIVLPLIYFIIVRKNPYAFLSGVAQALITALATASSSATLPVTYKCLEDNLKVDKRITRFVLPVGATINMDGTALYEAVAALYIAQLNDINLNAGNIIAASVTSTLASIGAASVPQAGIVTMIIVLSALGLPAEDVTRILAVDWLLDRIRTMINVMGDSYGAGIVAHLSKKELALPTPDGDDDDISHSSTKKVKLNGHANTAFDDDTVTAL